jgi:FtsP/CotA-like multicopper oxidase with cupredoxin domain
MSHETNVLTRRNFLRFTAGIGMAVGFDSFVPAYARPITAASEPENRREYPDIIDLQVHETTLKIGRRDANSFTVNGSLPGPLVRLREGQTATIRVTNHLKEDTSIHWHGLILPPEMDGVPGVSFAGIKPGKTFTYRFPVKQSGTYWYHSHSGMQEQQGHFGPLIIDPIEPEPFKYERDYVVMLSDWSFEHPHHILANLKKMSAYTIFAETMDRSGYACGTLALRQGMTAPIPERRTRPLRSMADMGMNHDEGGHSQHNMSGNNGEHSQHNMPGNDSGHSQHNMPGSDSGHSQHNESVMHGPDNHGPGNAGVPMMVQSRLHEPGIGLESTDSHRVLVYTDLRSLKPGYDQRQPEREIELHLTGNMERYMWSFDGKKYSQAKEPIRFYNGERLRFTFVNDTMMEHPIHLHGMWMELDNGSGSHNPRKHTINVKPAERLSVDITADAPGNWAFHCHLLYHMEVGMFRIVSVSDRVVGVGQ